MLVLIIHSPTLVVKYFEIVCLSASYSYITDV